MAKKKKMVIFVKDNDGKLQETTIAQLLTRQLSAAGFKMDNGGWPEENHNWIGVVQRNKDNTKEVVVNLGYENDGNTFTDVHVHVAEVKEIVDEENSQQIV